MTVKSQGYGTCELRNDYGNGFNAEFTVGSTADGKIDMDLTYVFEDEETEDNLGLLMTAEDAYAFASALIDAIREAEEYAGLEPRDFYDAINYSTEE